MNLTLRKPIQCEAWDFNLNVNVAVVVRICDRFVTETAQLMHDPAPKTVLPLMNTIIRVIECRNIMFCSLEQRDNLPDVFVQLLEERVLTWGMFPHNAGP